MEVLTIHVQDVYNVDLNDTMTLKTIIDDSDELMHRKNGKIGANFSLEIFLMILKEHKVRKSLITPSFVESEIDEKLEILSKSMSVESKIRLL